MRQLTFIRPGKLEWREAAAPAIRKKSDALVRPIAVATCDIDPIFIRGETPFSQYGPFAFGHEFVAEIVELGGEVTGFAVGDRVIVPFQLSCGACSRCTKGLTASCGEVGSSPTVEVGASRTIMDIALVAPPMFGFPDRVGGGWGGAFSDLVRVPNAQSMLVVVPAQVSTEAVASMSDNIPDAWRTVGPFLREQPGANVLILGGRSVGLYAVAIAMAMGAGRVDYIDEDQSRCETATTLGAHATQSKPPLRAGHYPITVNASSDPAKLACALRSVEPEGICTNIGMFYQETTLPLLEMYARGVRFHTARVNARAVIPDALALVGSGKLKPELVTSRVAGWDDAIEALLETPTKLVVTR